MKPLLALIVLIFQFELLAHDNPKFCIKKQNGRVVKTLRMPLKVRVKKTDSEIITLKLDSIKNNVWYGNLGKNSVALTDIKAVNIAGPKETIKYTAFVLSTAVAAGGFFLMNHAKGNSAYETPTGTSLMGASYMVIFTPISVLLYNVPKTRYKTKKYRFEIN